MTVPFLFAGGLPHLKVLHLISGGDTGGAKPHVHSLVRSLSKHIQVRLACFMEGPFYQEARDLGLDVVLLKQRRRYDLSVLRAIVRLVRDGGYDLLHAHGARANFLVALIKGQLGVPCLTTVHSDYRLDFLGSLYKNVVYTSLNSLALRRFDYYTTGSAEMRETLAKRGFAGDRVFVVHNGIDFGATPAIPPRGEVLAAHGLHFDAGELIVGTVGRLSPVKDQATFLLAAASILKKRPRVSFLLIGGGEELGRLQGLADSLGIREKVHFLGYQSNPHPLIGLLDVNVLTSASEGGVPYALLEGARLGRATVSTAVGGVRDLITDPSLGLLFSPGDHDRLAAHLTTFLGDEDLRRRLGQNLQAYARDHFSVERMGERQLQVYQTILQTGGRR